MKNSRLEENKCILLKEKINKKDFTSNFQHNLSKKYSKNIEIKIKKEKNKLPKSTSKTSLKKNEQIQNRQIKPFLTNNNIHNNKNNDTQKNRNILKNTKSNNNLANNHRNDNTRNKSKIISATNFNSNNNPKSPFHDHKSINKTEKNFCSKNHVINIQSPQYTDFPKNKNNNKNVIKRNNNNNILKSNLGLLITNNPNYEGDSLFKDNESYFENTNKLYNTNDRKKIINKNDLLIEKDVSSEDFLTKVNVNKNKNSDNSSLINSIMNINRYLTNDANNKNTNRLNRERNNKFKSKRIYENQLTKASISKNISIDKNITNMSKSDFLQDNNINKNNSIKKNQILMNKSINNEYYCPVRPVNNTNNNKIEKKRNSLNLNNDINKNIIFFENILGYNTPRITINNEFIKDFNFSPKNYNINKTLVNADSDFKNCSKNRIKVAKTKINKNNNNELLSLIKKNNKPKLEINEPSTKSNSNKNNNPSTERKNIMKINEFKIINEFDIANEENNLAKDNCNNIFDAEFDGKNTQLNKYNLLTCEKQNITNNNKRKKNYSGFSCIYSPDIHNKYNTLSSQRGKKYNYTTIDSENNGQYLKTLEEEDNGKIQEIKINLSNLNKRNRQKENIYSSNSYRLSENNYSNINYSCEKTKVNNQKVYMKQIFSNYDFNSKSKEKNKRNKQKINTDNINKLINLEDEYMNYVNKKCIYNSPKNININNNNIIQQNNFYSTNNFFNCSHKRIDENKNKNFSPNVYVKPSRQRNNQSNIYLNLSPQNQNFSPKINLIYHEIKEKQDKFNEKGVINLKTPITYNKYRTKAYIKKNSEINNKKNNELNNIKSKVVNNNIRCKKYYDYLLKIKPQYKPICYITKTRKKTKYMPKCKRSFITKSIFSFIQKPKSSTCYISKTNISISNISSSLSIHLNNKEPNIIKANILDFSLEQNKEVIKDTNKNHNRIIRYIRNEKNYQESFGEINLSFSTEEINSFRQKESTIEAVFSELINMNSVNQNTGSEVKITFCPNFKNNNYIDYNNKEATTFGRMINTSSNFAETERTERNERTSYKRDETIKEIKENINLNLPLKLNKNNISEKMTLNTERVHLNSNNEKIKGMINSKDVINFTEKLENIFDKKKNNTRNGLNSDKIRAKCMTYFPKCHKLEIKMNNIKRNNNNNEHLVNNNINEQNDESYENITFNSSKNNGKDDNGDFIYLLNIITITNFNEVNKEILNKIKNEKKNIQSFCKVLLSKFNNEKKYNILYAFLCENLLNELNEIEVGKDASSNLLNKSKKYGDLIQSNSYEKYIFNFYKSMLSNKTSDTNHKYEYCLHNIDTFDTELFNLMKKELIHFNSTNDLSLDKFNSIKLFNIIEVYLEICIDNTYDNKLPISNCNNFISRIISNHALNLDMKNDNSEIIELLLNVDNIVVDNKNMLEIMGYLLYSLIIYKIYNMKDFDSFLNKDEFTIFNLAKILKFTFSYCAKNNNNNYSLEFRETNLFKNNSQIFEKYTCNDIY